MFRLSIYLFDTLEGNEDERSRFMKRYCFILLIFGLVILPVLSGKTKENEREANEVNISMEEAKKMMDRETGYVILDVRTESEFAEGHIPNAVLIPYDKMEVEAEKILPNKEQLIFVYCRSGNRSKIAEKTLVEIGYTNVKEFGGIIDWPYEIE